MDTQSAGKKVVRPTSSHKARNPITEGDELKSLFSHKAQVPKYLAVSRRLNDRPRGIAHGEYSSMLQGDYRVTEDLSINYKPQKKHFEVGYSEIQPTSCKKMIRQTHTGNPILQDSSYDVPVHTSRKIGYTPSKLADKAQPNKQDSYIKRNSSNLFKPESTVEGSNKPMNEGLITMGSISNTIINIRTNV